MSETKKLTPSQPGSTHLGKRHSSLMVNELTDIQLYGLLATPRLVSDANIQIEPFLLKQKEREKVSKCSSPTVSRAPDWEYYEQKNKMNKDAGAPWRWVWKEQPGISPYWGAMYTHVPEYIEMLKREKLEGEKEAENEFGPVTP